MAKLPILIHKFYTVYEDDPKNPGTMRARDMVEYGPIGQANLTRPTERIDILSRPQKVAGANPAASNSQILWEFIKPRYEAWKNNQDLPTEGTPLAAWNHLTQTQAETLRVAGVRTVEDVAQLTDTHIDRLKIHNLRSIIEAAKKFAASTDVNKFAGEMKAKDDQLAAANARIDQMAEMLAKLMEEKEGEPKRRGRPPNQKSEAA